VPGTVKKLCLFQVVEMRGDINKWKLHHWQVNAFAECTLLRPPSADKRPHAGQSAGIS
jgi:hypothetical protein